MSETMESASLKNEKPNCGNTALPTILFVGAKLYRTSYNDIVEVITVERVTKTQAIAKGGAYKFDIEVSDYGTARQLGKKDRWSNTAFYLETP